VDALTLENVAEFHPKFGYPDLKPEKIVKLVYTEIVPNLDEQRFEWMFWGFGTALRQQESV